MVMGTWLSSFMQISTPSTEQLSSAACLGQMKIFCYISRAAIKWLRVIIRTINRTPFQRHLNSLAFEIVLRRCSWWLAGWPWSGVTTFAHIHWRWWQTIRNRVHNWLVFVVAAEVKKKRWGQFVGHHPTANWTNSGAIGRSQWTAIEDPHTLDWLDFSCSHHPQLDDWAELPSRAGAMRWYKSNTFSFTNLPLKLSAVFLFLVMAPI